MKSVAHVVGQQRAERRAAFMATQFQTCIYLYIRHINQTIMGCDL